MNSPQNNTPRGTEMTPSFSIGRHHVYRIEEWHGPFVPPEHLFTPFDEAVFAAEAPGFSPDYFNGGMVYGNLQSWLIDTPGELVLFDTGAGNGRNRPGFPTFGNMDTDFLEAMERAGFPVTAIDTVICSHLHIDHVGWNTMWKDGAWRPSFPNARYIFPAVELAAWDPQGPIFPTLKGAGVNAGVFEDSVQPILDAGRVITAEPGFEVLPGMSLRAAPGHSPGQMMLDVHSGNDRALFTADVFHHPMEMIRPDWNSVFCEDADQARLTRRAILEEAATTGARVVPAHFPGRHSVFVKRDGGGFRPVGL
jgi:glyoxylase-like metal-dependent hydrolase (beta-lactamase superfamily II)